MPRDNNPVPDPSAFGPSDRLRIRTGSLARTQREDHAVTLDTREPDELFEPLENNRPSSDLLD